MVCNSYNLQKASYFASCAVACHCCRVTMSICPSLYQLILGMDTRPDWPSVGMPSSTPTATVGQSLVRLTVPRIRANETVVYEIFNASNSTGPVRRPQYSGILLYRNVIMLEMTDGNYTALYHVMSRGSARLSSSLWRFPIQSEHCK